MSSRAVGGASSSGRIGSLFSFILSIVLLFGASGAWAAESRSITGVERKVSAGAMSLDVTFEAGDPGDKHALYIAYDTEDKGGDIANWATLQRGYNVTAEATSATIPVSPLLTGKGYTVCRVFLTTSAAPYDTLIESLRQTGTQYIDTGIKPDATSVAVMDTKFDSNATRQQRFFGISSGSSNNAKLSFDCYINGSGNFASACQNGKGNWKEAGPFTTDRVRISLSAAEKHHVTITNLVTGAQIANKNYNTNCDATSITNLIVFALYNVDSWSIPADRIAKGARLYSFTMSNSSGVLCDYKPCKLGDRVGVYDSVTGTIIYSASGTDFDAANSGSPVACSLLAGETQLSAAPSATGLFFDYTWRGTAANWGDTDAWTLGGENATWTDGENALFETANATATLADDVSANSIAFSADATVDGTGELSVKSVSVDSGVSATISAPISSAFEKTGAGTLTLTQNRTSETTVTEGTLKMDGATIADLTLGTDGGAPVALDYGGQELLRNPQDFLVTGSTVTLTNGIFTAISGSDLNFRDDLSETVFSSVLTIAKDATVRENGSKKVYICKGDNGTSTINVAGGTLGKFSGTQDCYIQHKSVSGRVNINVTNGGLLSFPGVVYALCRGDIDITSPSLYMTLFSSTFNTGGTFNFGSSYSNDNYVPTNPTGVFAATNSVVSVGDGFIVGRNKQDAKADGSLTVDFENCVVTAKTFAVYYDRPLNNARFNGTRFVFGAASGSFAASDDAANWITVGDDGLTLDTQAYSATLNANLGGSGTVTKVGAGTLTVSRDQATTGGISVDEGTLAINGSVTFAGPVVFESGSTLSVTAPSIDNAALSAPSIFINGEMNISIPSQRFADGKYKILEMSDDQFGADVLNCLTLNGGKGDESKKYALSVEGNTIYLEVTGGLESKWVGGVGDNRFSVASNWDDGKVPEEGSTLDFSGVTSTTQINADVDKVYSTILIPVPDSYTFWSSYVKVSGTLHLNTITNATFLAVAENGVLKVDGDAVLNKDAKKLGSKSSSRGCYMFHQNMGVIEIGGNLVNEANPTDRVLMYISGGSTGVLKMGGVVNNSDKAISLCGNHSTPILCVIGENGLSGKYGYFQYSGSKAEITLKAGYDFTVGVYLTASYPFKFDTSDETGTARTITLDAQINGSGKVTIVGNGRVVANSSVNPGTSPVTVEGGATLAINSGKLITNGKMTVNSGATLSLPQSGAVTLGGDLELTDGSTLAFNFTERKVGPLLALASEKLLSFVGEGEKNIAVKVSGDVWPVGGKHILTATGGFNVEGVTVSLAEGAPKWAKSVYVNDAGNIVLDVKPRGTRVIVR